MKQKINTKGMHQYKYELFYVFRLFQCQINTNKWIIGYLLANFVQFNAYFDPFLHKKPLVFNRSMDIALNHITDSVIAFATYTDQIGLLLAIKCNCY